MCEGSHSQGYANEDMVGAAPQQNLYVVLHVCLMYPQPCPEEGPLLMVIKGYSEGTAASWGHFLCVAGSG